MEFNATFIVAFVSFIVFTIIMNLILYKPLSAVVEKRQKFIDDHYEEAKLNTKKADAILRDKERKIEKTKHESKKVILEKTNEVKTQKSEMTAHAQLKAGNTIDSAKETLQKSKDEAQSVLSNQVIDLAQNISSRILGENIAIKDVDGQLVNKIMQEG